MYATTKFVCFCQERLKMMFCFFKYLLEKKNAAVVLGQESPNFMVRITKNNDISDRIPTG